MIFLPLFCFSLPTANAAGRLESQSSQYLPDRIIVKFATGSIAGPQRATLQTLAMPPQVSQILANFGTAETVQLFPFSSPSYKAGQKSARQRQKTDLSTVYEIRLAQPANVIKLAQLLRQQPGVIYAEPVYLRQLCYNPNDPSIGNQSYLTNIKAREAWDVTRGDTSVVIAIVDTGVDWSHPDLAANIWRNYDEIPNNGIDDDRNGQVDDIRGWDFGGNGTEDNNPREDTPTHGTFVAGCAAAVTDNSIGVSGVGFRSKIMPVKVSVSGSSGIPTNLSYSGIAYAAENGADIINCSWGGCGYSQFEQDVIDYAAGLGALVVAAVGNDGTSSLFYPAAYRNVLSVGSTNSSDRKSSFSNYGYWLDIVAPGQNMYNTYQPNTYVAGFQGTSFSSPVVAGVAALVKAVHKDWRPEAVAEQVRLAADNIDNLNAGYERQLGSGRLNAFKAVTLQNLSAVRLVSYSAAEANGDGDGIFEPNEEIALTVKLANHLEPVNNLTISFSSASPYASALSGSKNLSRIGRSDTVQVSGTFNFRIAANAPGNHQAVFYLNFSASGYVDWQGFSVLLRAPQVDLLGGNVATTITNFGALGFDDYAECGFGQLGRGFEFPIGSASALFHGGLMLATASNRVSDVSYGNDTHERYDFVTASGGELNIGPGRKSTVEATARFNDSGATTAIGLTIDQKAYAWANAPWDDFVILEYTIQNTTLQTLNNLYAGYYLDWDINKSDENFAGWDNANQLGYEWGNNSAYYGVTAILPNRAASYRAVKNPDFVWNGFTDASKYQFMSGGFSVVSSDSANDWSQLLSYGPVSLAAGKTVTVAFAILGGTNLADLQANARAARDAYTALSVGIDSPNESTAPLRFELAQNTPNPFANRLAASTAIHYSLAEPGPVTLRIFNLLGQEVVVLVQRLQDRGSYVAQWNGRDRRGLVAPSGVYFYQLKTPAFTATRKLIVVE